MILSRLVTHPNGRRIGFMLGLSAIAVGLHLAFSPLLVTNHDRLLYVEGAATAATMLTLAVAVTSGQSTRVVQ